MFSFHISCQLFPALIVLLSPAQVLQSFEELQKLSSASDEPLNPESMTCYQQPNLSVKENRYSHRPKSHHDLDLSSGDSKQFYLCPASSTCSLQHHTFSNIQTYSAKKPLNLMPVTEERRQQATCQLTLRVPSELGVLKGLI